MKKEFSWYIRPSDEEFAEIWKAAVLTVDANVLLDLYRYNKATRESLIKSIEEFKDRAWLSRQAAEEFVRNRYRAIISVAKSFKDAESEVGKLRDSLSSAISQLKGNRIVAKEVISSLSDSVESAVNQAERSIKEASDGHPDFLSHDPILDRILNLFDGSVGSEYTEDKKEEIKAEAQRRIDEQVPPGFLDDDKDGERKYGDYFLWRQILDYAKDNYVPIIFITSERKNDWWEIYSGQTVGLRPELLKEAAATGQRILVYKTERFLEFAAESTGTEVDKSAVEDIQAVSEARSVEGMTVELIQQSILEANAISNKGTLKVRLHRPVYKFTCSGQLKPRMNAPPNVWIRLSDSPEEIPSHKLGAGAGTIFDFNAHIKSEDYGVSLPTGIYVLEYEATCENSDNDSIS